MPLSAGTKLGPYEILAPIGAGGMGEVYQARDSRLHRLVAIKILSRENRDEGRLRLFQEARAASALNHPNIVTIYDVGSENGVDYIALEFVDGQTLDQLIASGGMRPGELLRLAAQAAGALARAHQAGIVHRDLKPSNIMVARDGVVKILDFGLAKFSPASRGESDATQTLNVLTGEGVVMGTVHYMSPEQAQGAPVDARSDIFSFGAVLFEMATGRRPFTGESKAAVLASILRDEPDLAATPRSDLPPELSRVILRCLRKDPARRFQHMADLKVSLEDLQAESDSRARPSRRSRRIAWAVAGAAVFVAAALAIWRWFFWPPPVTTLYTPSPVTSYAGNQMSPSFSPDGSQIVFAWNGPGEDNFDIYVKLVGAGTPLRLTTDPAFDFYPRWSPDGRWIAFIRIADKTDSFSVILIPALGGPERRLGIFHNHAVAASLPLESLGWTRDSKALVVSAAESTSGPNRLVLIPLEGGDAKVLTRPGADLPGDGLPAISRDGRRLLFLREAGFCKLLVLPLSNAMEPAGEPQPIDEHQANATAAEWLPDGEIILASNANGASTLFRIFARRSSPERVLSGTGSSAFSPTVSERGNRLAYVTGTADTNFWALDLETKTAVFDRSLSSSFRDVFPQFSPDGKRVAFESTRNGTAQVWTANRDGSQAAAITSAAGAGTGRPRWSPDGRQIVFDSDAGGTFHIYTIGEEGGQPRQVTTGESYSGSWSRDGRWIYFSSHRSGGEEVWKVPAPGGTAVQITHAGGAGALESPDGKVLYYVKRDGNGGLWKMPAAGGPETQLVPDVYRLNYAVTENGIYFTPHIALDYTSSVEFLNFATGAITRLVKTKPLDLGLGLSPDGRTLLYTQVDQTGSNIMLVENFR